jgi:hypothetical protein
MHRHQSPRPVALIMGLVIGVGAIPVLPLPAAGNDTTWTGDIPWAGSEPVQFEAESEEQAILFDAALTLAMSHRQHFGYPWIDKKSGTLIVRTDDPTLLTSGDTIHYIGDPGQPWARNVASAIAAGPNCPVLGDSGAPAYKVRNDGKIVALGIFSGFFFSGVQCSVFFTDIRDSWVALPGNLKTQ